MPNESFTRDRKVTATEYLTQFSNFWTEQMYANMVDYEKAKAAQRKNPALQEMTQMGIVPIAQRIEQLASGVREAKEMRERCEKFLTLSPEELEDKVQEIIDFINKPKLDIVVPK